MNDLRFIKDILYTLKRAYGRPVNIVWRVSSTADLETGVKSVVQDSFSVDRVIVLPATTDRNFAYDLAYIASNKNYSYGGFYDKNRRRIVLERSDLPPDFEIKIGYFFIFEEARYEVKAIDNFGERLAYDLDCQEIDNIDLENQIKRRYFDDLFLTHNVEVVK